MAEKEMVNHPSHYGGADNTYEVIKIIDAYDLNFDLGNVIKYTLRAGLKDDVIQDLEKAKWYLQHEIDRKKQERQETKQNFCNYHSAEQMPAEYANKEENKKTLLFEDTRG